MQESAHPLRAFNAVREQHAEVVAGHAKFARPFFGVCMGIGEKQRNEPSTEASWGYPPSLREA
jgi:hypothetical protein